METVNIHRQEQATLQKKQCRQKFQQFIHKKMTYRGLHIFMKICFGLAILALAGCATLFLMLLVLDMTGLGLALLSTVGGLVLFGGLGVLALWGLQRLLLDAGGELLRDQAYTGVNSHYLQQPQSIYLNEYTSQSRNNQPYLSNHQQVQHNDSMHQ